MIKLLLLLLLLDGFISLHCTAFDFVSKPFGTIFLFPFFDFAKIQIDFGRYTVVYFLCVYPFTECYSHRVRFIDFMCQLCHAIQIQEAETWDLHYRVHWAKNRPDRLNLSSKLCQSLRLAVRLHIYCMVLYTSHCTSFATALYSLGEWSSHNRTPLKTKLIIIKWLVLRTC